VELATSMPLVHRQTYDPLAIVPVSIVPKISGKIFPPFFSIAGGGGWEKGGGGGQADGVR